MKAVVYHGLGDIRLDNVHDPKINEETDVLVKSLGPSSNIKMTLSPNILHKNI